MGVFVDDTHASSSWVPYSVYSADPNTIGAQITHTVYADESHIGTFQGPYGWENTGPKWVAIGTYYFRTSMQGRVVVNNATGESGAQLSADGVKFVPAPGSRWLDSSGHPLNPSLVNTNSMGQLSADVAPNTSTTIAIERLRPSSSAPTNSCTICSN